LALHFHDQDGLPSDIYGARHRAIIRSNLAQSNITEEITIVENAIAPNRDAVAVGQALNTAKQAHKEKLSTLRETIKEARAIAAQAKRDLLSDHTATKAALESMAALLDTANIRLVQAGAEKVTAKVAPTANGAAGSPTDVMEGASGASGGIAETSPLCVDLFTVTQD
jgi:hypothetical protein